MMIGKRLSGRYKILNIIGGGGMANVYLAHDMILDRDVAVKMLRLDFANDEEFIRRFRREAQAATSLAHPNIVNIYDVGEENDLYYIVMEYVDGQTLKQYIQQNSPLRVEKAIEIMKQLTSAISHAHHNHIIHRDIKPHNILIDHEGNVKVTDFGIATALSATAITQTNSVLGSVHYLSPEQARGGMANRKSDIYSLGIVMFELLTGRLPFSGESAVSIALKHLQSETPSVRRWNPSIPQSVENIVLKATAKDPFHRYNSVDEMEEDLQTALDPERMNEAKFAIPVDDEATKAIPVITNDKPLKNLEETLVHSTENTAEKPTEKTKKEKKKEKKNKKRKKWPLVLVSIFLFLCVIGLLSALFLPGILSAKEVKVPNVSGMELDDAVSKLKQSGLGIDKKIKITSEEVEEGLVIKTDPEAGETVKEKAKVTLYISSGKKKLELSNYVGRNYDDVVRLLDDKFKDIKKIEKHDDSAPGTILSQNPPEGEQVVPEDTVLEFEVSLGPEIIVLKDLTQYSLKGAQDYCSLVGLTLDASQEQYDEKVPAGMVISQSPKEGTELKKGDKVTVVISKGEKPPKKVVKEITIPFEPDPENPDKEQVVQIYIDDMNRNMTEPAETFNINATKKVQIELTIPYGKKAGYRVMKDNTVFMEEVINYSDID
ncbi:Stk1 family PASTA domain-containing Ser/Thr kinase [Neobacillus sp. OS1-32]|jgi:serine/threonine protein kinase|uniref:non-specific serine/threonine protein kinase n=1 Tax=Neobacillus paridis TaxID=2803862 RepID=A0ABS1TRV6_9BACI|nr:MULTISPECIES: Stk1 family PASTA domain-containing Ser/Thr kinase [Neobacillus]MBL4952635.1 Stk1 family PASTA domain-containing Ser/Thr kinase [Neobacillus paridis]WML31855.1 Stk1 family PASTA domain-containing Ser/Thr kinase [Neobacillus sp. OS1-32]